MGMSDTHAKSPDAAAPLELLRQAFPEGVVEISFPQGDAMAVVLPQVIRGVMDFLKNDARLQYDMLTDMTAVDHLGRKPRFEVVYHLLSLPFRRRLRIKVSLEEAEPTIDSLTPLWGGANWLEREIWDMYGIRFAGHPNLRRILLYEEFQGHPLRKDYPIRKRQPLIGPRN
jgi:NADH-quinone oxidoreductase subunit C